MLIRLKENGSAKSKLGHCCGSISYPGGKDDQFHRVRVKNYFQPIGTRQDQLLWRFRGSALSPSLAVISSTPYYDES
jgi:hypothetical protein